MLEPKDNVVHFRITNDEKDEINKQAIHISGKTPYICMQCETRFTDEEDEKYKHICPYCGGKLKQQDACPSQIMRYVWNFARDTQNYSYYDALLVMNNTGMKQILDGVSLSDFGDDGVTLGVAISSVINGNGEIRKRLLSMPFNAVLREFFAKTQEERKKHA